MPVHKIPWTGVITSVQPRIRLNRSFDERIHSYQGYMLRIDGHIGDEQREFIVAVGEGLLGNPEMFIRGNGSTPTHLKWFQARAGGELPQPRVISCSVWFYRFAMLAWALWLAAALIRWLKWGWNQFSSGGCWKRRQKKKVAVPPASPAARA